MFKIWVMKRFVSGIGVCLLVVMTSLGQEDLNTEVKRFSVYSDTLLFNSEFRQLDYDYNKNDKYFKRDLNFDYLSPSFTPVNPIQQIQKSLAIPGAMAFVGLYSGHQDNTNSWIGKHTIQEQIREDLPGFRSYLDDYIQWGPIAMTYGLKAAGIRGANDIWTSTKLLLKAEFLTGIICHTFKNLASNTRPNGRNTKSFPSGHTSQAFVAATFMHKEFGHISPWYSVAAYGMASTVGCMRMMNNMHWFSDVMVGAAIGIATTNLVYLNYNNRQKKKKRHLVAVPTASTEHIGVAMNVTF